jgi:hypothetical protein
MAIYDDRLEAHPVWASLPTVREALDATRDKVADPEQVEVHARIEAVLDYAEGRLRLADAQIVPFNVMDSVSGNLQQVEASLRQFEANPGNRTILDQADNQASGILAYLAQIPVATAQDVENLREVGARYRRSMSAQIGQLTGEFNALETKLGELDAQVSQQESQVATEVARLGQEAADAKSAFDTAQEERQGTFERQGEDFEARVKVVTDTGEEALTAVVNESQEEMKKALGEVSEKAEAVWADIAALKERAETASNYLGINAMAGGYHQSAEAEERRAFWMRVSAIACFVGAIAASVLRSPTTSPIRSRSTGS